MCLNVIVYSFVVMVSECKRSHMWKNISDFVIVVGHREVGPPVLTDNDSTLCDWSFQFH